MKKALLLLILGFAVRLFAANPWGINDPELIREYITPRTSLGENEVPWEPVLKPIAQSITLGATTPLEAATLLNRHLWKQVNVIYSTKRDKANQDPLHSMRIGLASCSGLSILLVDACRSLKIPARVVGCRWKHKPGNHTWVEVWSEGEWFALGAFEDTPSDQLWFLEDAAHADANDPRYAIYAARATFLPEGTTFYGWGDIPAENITARYARKEPKQQIQVHIAAERNGERVEVPFTVNGVRYTTPGPLRDLNDMTRLTFPCETHFTIEIEGQQFIHRATPNARIILELPPYETDSQNL